MYTDKDIKSIAQTIYPKYSGQYDYIGIRIQEKTHGAQIGKTVAHQSYVWIDGRKTRKHLDGVSAVNAKTASRNSTHFGGYSGDVALILGANGAEYGEDDGEIIMRNPVVLDIIS